MKLLNRSARRVRGAAVAGIALGVAAVLAMTGCADSRSAGTTAASAPASSTAGSTCDLSAYTSAKIDWKQFSGKTVTLAVEEHPWWETISPQISCFEELTGITVKPSVLGEDQFVAKLPTQLSAGATTPDVYMVNQFGQAQSSGWLEQLDAYINNPSLTDPTWYKVDDFFAGARSYAQANGQYFALPITAEAQMLFIRTDLVKTPPATMADLEKAAASATSGDVAGFGSRAVANANETPWPFGGFAFSNGGEFLDASGKAGLDSAANVQALTEYAKLIKQYGPKGASGWGYLQNQQAMQQGKLAIWTDSSTFLGSLKDTSKSKFGDKIDAFPFPTGASGKSLPNAWYWTIGMNSKSEQKQAAWLFMQWATSAPISEAGAAKGASPARQSAWESKTASSTIGTENAKRVEQAIASVDSSFLSNAWKNASWSQVADPLARAINSAVTGGDPAASLKEAQTTAQSVLK